MIPWQAREAVRQLVDLTSRWKTSRDRSRMRRSEKSGVSVGFGGVLDDGRPIHGGAVKLLPLRAAFGGGEAQLNILYAVSSSQPRFAGDLFGLCRERGIRTVWNQNGVGFPAWAGRESERFNGPMGQLRAMADFVVYQSEFCRVSAEKFLGPFAGGSEILYNPVDCDVFVPGERREGDGVRLLCAGTHGTRDRVMPCLDAVVELRRGGIDASLTVAGRFQWAKGEADFAREVATRGLEAFVRRVAVFSQADAAGLYQGHDVLLHPKYMDPCPTVVLEALACGLPVVGSRSGGMPEIVSATCGLLVDCVEDWDVRQVTGGAELAAAVGEIGSKLGEMAAAARRHAVETFPVDRWVEDHARIFRGLLE